jgi:hypothetical protein
VNETLAKALVAVQREMPAIAPNATNPHFRNQYVTLDHLLAKALPVLHKHGVALVQFPSHNDLGHPTLTTLLVHESGDEVRADMPLFLPKNDPQGQGSAITYARRYAFAAALGISGERDDDGEAASDAAVTHETAAAAQQGMARAPQQAAQTSQAAPASPNGFVFPSGKHQGKTLAEVDASYLDWYMQNGPRDDVKQAISAFRGGPSPAAPSDDDIPFAPTGAGGF